MPQKSLLAILALMLALGVLAPLELLIISADSKTSALSDSDLVDSAAEPAQNAGAALSATKKASRRRTSTKSNSASKRSKATKKTNSKKSTADSELDLPQVDIRLVKTESELFAAVADLSVAQITLSSDIVTVANLEINRNLTIDLNGFNLTSLKEDIRIVDIKYGEVIITGKGSIVAYGPGGAAVRVKGATTADNTNYSHVTIDRDVTLFAPNYYGLFVTPNFNAAYGVTVDFYGSMIAQDGLCINGNIQGMGEHAPVINLLDGAEITVDENSGTAIYAAGYGVWNIGQVKIDAATGIGIKSGVLNLQNTHITTTGTFDDPTGWDHGILGVGAVIQIEDNSDYTGNIHISIDGGEYRSINSHVFVEYGNLDAPYSLQSFEIKSGDFSGQLGVFYGIAPSDDPNTATAVFGGSFSEDITSYLAPEHHLDLSGNSYLVIDEQELYAQGIEAHLVQTRSRLQELMTLADNYINSDYAKGDLGAWRPRVKTLLTTLKRMQKLAQKADHPKSNLEKLESSIRSLSKAIKNLESIGDEIRTEIFSTIAAIDSIIPSDYTAYSYNQLIEAVDAARLELDRNDITLEELYSTWLDLEINIDLLEEATDEVPEEYHAPLLLPTSTISQEPASPITSPDLEPLTPDLDILESEDEELISLDLLRKLGASVLLATIPEPEPEVESLPTIPLASPVVSLAPQVFSTPNPQPVTILPPHPVEDAAYIEAKTNLLTMLSAVDNLAISDYDPSAAEQFGELQVAIAKARAALVKPFVNPETVLEIMEEIQAAITGLKTSPNQVATEQSSSGETQAVAESVAELTQVSVAHSPNTAVETVDWTPLRDVITDVSSLDPTIYTEQSYAKVLSELQRAKALLTYPATTQDMIEDIVFDINLAILELDTIPAVYTVDNTSHQPLHQQDVAPAASTPVTTQNPSLPISNTISSPDDDLIAPSFLMSMMAGAYAGLATYHRSRLAAKKRRLS